MTKQVKASPKPEGEKSEQKNKKLPSRQQVADEPNYGTLPHILDVLDRLNEAHRYDESPADLYATGEPLDGLLLTLLSQNTNDRNRDMAYEKLRSAYSTWRKVACLPVGEIASLIKSAGLGDTKAARMKDILQKIRLDFGDYSLKKMFDWSQSDVREYLSALPGIGPKTVACVMVFDLDMPAFPVDTHVARLSKRFGWAGEKTPPEKIQLFLEEIVPVERCRGGHLNMIEHGRRVCHARKPACDLCNASDLCKFHRENHDRPE